MDTGTQSAGNTIFRSIFAGILISLGGCGYLALGGIPGAVIFSFGLVAVVLSSSPLYTGKAGRVLSKPQFTFSELGCVLLGNVIGAALIGVFAKFANPSLALKAEEIVGGRMAFPMAEAFLRAAGCGLIIDICVWLWRKERSIVAILLGVPLFIVCGFLHSIADAFYLVCGMGGLEVRAIPYYIIVVIGNFLGCNVRRIWYPET